MNNIIVAVKKFFKNKNTVTLIALVVALGGLYWVYNWRIQRSTQPVSVPYAVQAIGPRTYIGEELIATKKVPGGVVTGEVYTSVSEIVGKYVNKDAVVPTNGLFYKSAVVQWEDISETIYSNIPDGHTIFYLPVNQNKTYGNSIFPGNYIDLYYKHNDSKESNKIMIGKFVESIRVLAVTDGRGNNIFETIDDLQSPAYLIFSVDEDLHLLLRKAVFSGGDVFPVPRNAAYSENPKPTTVVNSTIKNYILDLSYNLGDDSKVGGLE